MTNPFVIEGPALWSFRGGRTSAYMLWRALEAYQGALPEDHFVVFANTGKEREETLRFVHECGVRWGVHVHWIEWLSRGRHTPLKERFREVGYNSASRNGEPFEALIKRKGYLPNPRMRYCTVELKIRIMGEFMRAAGYKKWSNVIGLRYDEGHRVLKAIDRNETGKERYTSVMPLSKSKVTVRDVTAFWASQPFDLQLRSHEGNCDLCFLKTRGKRSEIIRRNPEMADWWIQMEANAKPYKKDSNLFVLGESYASLREAVVTSPMLDLPDPSDDEHDAECGLWCAGEAS